MRYLKAFEAVKEGGADWWSKTKPVSKAELPVLGFPTAFYVSVILVDNQRIPEIPEAP